MRRYGLVGYPVEHSFSADYFAEKFRKEDITNCEYVNYPLPDPSLVRNLFREDPLLSGVNVTIPHKRSVIQHLDMTDDTAEVTGAVNVIKAYRNRGDLVLKGFNTDLCGFEHSLPADIRQNRGKTIVLGTGGASSAVVYVLKRIGFEVIVVSRSRNPGVITYRELQGDLLASARLIVNTTPLGMYPVIDRKPDIAYEYLGQNQFLYDLIYNPELTGFMREGLMRGCRVMNGLKMLLIQADKAWELWNDDAV